MCTYLIVSLCLEFGNNNKIMSELFFAQMQDISLGVALGSATQIAVFVVRI